MSLKKSIDNVNNATVAALLTLLEDENLEIASLAMEQFLELGPVTDQTIAEHQESQNPQMRHRIHQLSSILARRRRRDEFIEEVNKSKLTLWDGLLKVNSLYDPSCPEGDVNRAMDELVAELGDGALSTARLAGFMREQEFLLPSTVPVEEGSEVALSSTEKGVQGLFKDYLDADLYLLEHVLATRYGSSALLCAIAQRFGELRQWESSICLHEGRFCLLDRSFMLIDPSEGWQLTTPEGKDRYHICSRRDVLLAVLCQLFLVALVDGNLRDLHHFGTLLTGLNNGDLTDLPFPVGPAAV